MGLHDFGFYDLICRSAQCFKGSSCWLEVEDGRDITFDHYKEMTDRLAEGLRKQGLEKGDRIGVLGKNCLEYFLLYGAAAALGAIMLPLNWRLSPDEVAYIINDGTPRFLFVDREYEPLADGIRGKVSSVEKYFTLRKGGSGTCAAFMELMKGDGAFEPEAVGSEDGFVIIHTAAVAGRPRGALLSHGNVLLASLYFNGLFNLTEKDVHLGLLPLFHVAGLFMATTSFQAGVPTLNTHRFDAEQAAGLIEENRVSLLFVFAPILSSILEQHDKNGCDLSSLRAVIGIDTTETIERYQEMTGGTFYSMYGQTETSCLATAGRYDERPGSAGRVIPMAQVRLVDDHGNDVAGGAAGEIVMRGPMVFKGYWNLPEENAYTFRGGWHHTGDLGRFDAAGYLFYTGRKAEKELIKPGGENVYPAEVEKVILQHPAVMKTVVFGVPDPKWKEGIKAVCLLREGTHLSSKSLIDFVGQRIARFKKPQYVEFTSDFPLLEDDSPDRERIKTLYGQKVIP